MSVGEAFLMSGQVYVLGIAIALGMAALIKLICYVIDKSDQKAEIKAQSSGSEGGRTG